MYKFIILMLFGYFVYRMLKGFLLGTGVKANMKRNDKPREENFQQKHADNIEDADFEELE